MTSRQAVIALEPKRCGSSTSTLRRGQAGAGSRAAHGSTASITTDRLIVTVEGKRTETLPSATDWYPRRSQLVRNLGATHQLAKA
jgi:hypothetical protein